MLVDLELGALKLGGGGRDSGDLHLAELGDDLGVRVVRQGERCAERGSSRWRGALEQVALFLNRPSFSTLSLTVPTRSILDLGGVVRTVVRQLLAAGAVNSAVQNAQVLPSVPVGGSQLAGVLDQGDLAGLAVDVSG